MGQPYRMGEAILERPDVLSWPVPSALSEEGRNRLSEAMAGEIQVIEAGWSLGVDGRLSLTKDAAEAKARMDEYFAILWRHREYFSDQVVEARSYVGTMMMRDLVELLMREGDPMLASVVLGARLQSRGIRVLGSLEEAVEDVARNIPSV